MFQRSILLKLLLFFIALTTVTMALFTVYWANHYIEARERAFETETTLIEKSLRGSLGAAVWDIDDAAASEVLEGLREIASFRFAELIVDGDVFAATAVSQDEAAQQAWRDEAEAVRQDNAVGRAQNDAHVTLAAPVLGPDGEMIGALTLVFSTEALNAEIVQSVENAALVGLAAVLAFAALTAWKLVAVARPLSRAATALQPGEEAGRVVLLGENRRDEIGQLARAVALFRESRAQVADLQAREEEARARAEAERKAMLGTLQNEVGDVVRRCSEGDFGARVSAEFSDGALSALARAVNTLVDQISSVSSDLSGMLTALSVGDLRHRIDAEYQGMFAKLTDDANQTAARLTDTFTELQDAARHSRASVDELDRVASALSTRAHEQADSLRSIADRMEEFSASTKENSANAEEIGQMMSGTEEALNSSDSMAKEAIDAMQRIDEFSKKIVEITAMVDNIAFQTNLLALNASVEAARAGEAGRGFAIVASEVRSLAERSTNAAKEITKVISSSSAAIEEGRDLVEKTGGNISSVVSAVGASSSRTREIIDSARAQAAAVGDLTEILSGVDHQTVETAELAAKSATIAQALRERAAFLDEMAAGFKTDRTSLKADQTGRSDAA